MEKQIGALVVGPGPFFTNRRAQLVTLAARYAVPAIYGDRDIAEAGGSPAIVQAVVNIAAERNMTTTAEGVETEQQKQKLRALGCTEMQGYLFSAAKPGPEVRKLLGTSGGKAAAVA